jgi:hypothetical protein
MMEPRHKEAGHDSWTGRYERLRQHALGEPAPTSGCFFGLEALLQNGMAVWMRVLPTAGTRAEEMEPAYAACDWLATTQRQTTLVLAEMALPQLFQIQTEELYGK